MSIFQCRKLPRPVGRIVRSITLSVCILFIMVLFAKVNATRDLQLRLQTRAFRRLAFTSANLTKRAYKLLSSKAAHDKITLLLTMPEDKAIKGLFQQPSGARLDGFPGSTARSQVNNAAGLQPGSYEPDCRPLFCFSRERKILKIICCNY